MTDERRRFEIVLYNSIVRDLVERQESHKDLKDEWAENHYLEVFARNADEARRKIESRYPPRKGFVVAEIIASVTYDDEDDEATDTLRRRTP